MGDSIINQDTTEIILESISDGVFTIDNDWKITSFNKAAEKITGIQRKEAIGRYCWDIFRSNMCERQVFHEHIRLYYQQQKKTGSNHNLYIFVNR